MRGFLARCCVAAAVVLTGCASPDRRPSFLLVVLDTTRADAVSAYGSVAGTTPNVDALAREGLRYTNARSQAPWTLPSHATLFTGLLPSEHQVSWARTRASDDLTTLAERLRDAGYDTFGVSENPWVSAAFNMTQGFDGFRDVKGFTLDPHTADEHDDEARGAVEGWLRTRRRDRPFFLFVNVLDAHLPYLVRAENPFLPAGIDAERARAIPQNPDRYFCSADPHAEALAVLRGLYLGGVHAADRKLGAIRALLSEHGADRTLVTIVTADHGEHFGEHRLVGHSFSVREPLLRVPLIVHGAGLPPAVIDTPVALADVMPTVLSLASVPAPAGLAGEVLPFAATGGAPRAIVAEQDDSDAAHGDDPDPLAVALRQSNRAARRNCSADDRVFGAMRALVRGRFKLIWYERHPPALYDLESDPGEDVDVSAGHATETAALESELDTLVAGAAAAASSRRSASGAPVANEATDAARGSREAAPPAAVPTTFPSDVRDRLRALGYLRDGGERSPP